MQVDIGKILDFSTAYNLIISSLKTITLDVETVHISTALGRVLAEDIIASEDIPLVDNSAMDGYCLRYEDVAYASEDNPVELQVTDYIDAGVLPQKLKEKACAYIATGGMIPEGADTVINLEQVEIKENPDRIVVRKAPIKGQFVRKIGSDLKSGEKVLLKGTKLGVTELATLCSLGKITVKVFKKPKVAILTSGNEVIMPFETPKPWQVRNSNSTLLLNSLKLTGAVPYDLGIVRDELHLAVKSIESAIDFADILITSGGISKGRKDPFIQAFEKINVQKIFHGVSIKPGKPLYFGHKEKCFIFGLPGNQASNFVTYNLFVRPFIQKFCGMNDYELIKLYLPIAKEIINNTGRDHFLRGKLYTENLKSYVMPFDQQESHTIASIKDANVLIYHPFSKHIINKDEVVKCYLLNYY